MRVRRLAKLNQIDSALIHVRIDSDGTILEGVGDVTVSKGSTGVYVITPVRASARRLGVVAAIAATSDAVANYSSTDSVSTTITWKAGGSLADTEFALTLMQHGQRLG
jgi:hypothetical protein